MEAIARQSGSMQFVTFANSNHAIVMDAGEKVKGEDTGIRPKEMVLSGLVGCTAMDVSSLLRKMKVDYDNFEVNAEAEISNEQPKVFTSITIEYRIWGDELPESKIEKAIRLSQNEYCGVSAMLREACEIEYEYFLNPE